jgi:hypothetical protein
MHPMPGQFSPVSLESAANRDDIAQAGLILGL